jgi:hypothetical protein
MGYCLLHEALRTAAVVGRNSDAFSIAEELDIVREGLFPFSSLTAEQPINQLRDQCYE